MTHFTRLRVIERDGINSSSAVVPENSNSSLILVLHRADSLSPFRR